MAAVAGRGKISAARPLGAPTISLAPRRPQTPGDAPAPPPVQRPWRGARLARSRTDRVVAGVAGGLGERFGVDPLLIRAAFALLTVAGGSGVALYLAGWAVSFEPEAGAASQEAGAAGRRQANPRQVVALGLIVAGSVLLLREAGLWFGDTLAGPLSLALLGSAVIWARSDDRDRARWSWMGRRLPGHPLEAVLAGPGSPPRILAGVLLVAGGMGLLYASITPSPWPGRPSSPWPSPRRGWD